MQKATFFIVGGLLIAGFSMAAALFYRLSQSAVPVFALSKTRPSMVEEIQGLHRLETAIFTVDKAPVSSGQVVAGVDFSLLISDQVQLLNGVLLISLPAPEIFFVSTDSMETDQRSILLTACENGILDQAAEGARKQVIALATGLGYSNIRVEMPPGECVL
ncbi:MAG: DUF4230 domain-containing protein [bacterium]|nr:DUF4230 domain-containing protein [bacterium]